MITINNLDFGYTRNRNIFTEINLHIKKGHIYGLLGKNGAGKSTLLKLTCGLLFPKKGSIDVLGNIPAQRKPDFLNEIFFIPEEFTMPAYQQMNMLKIMAFFIQNSILINLLKSLKN